MSRQDSFTDETIPPQGPTRASVGRQFKRARTATQKQQFPADLPPVTDTDVGDRMIGTVGMSVQHLLNQPGQGEQEANVAIGAAAINAACQPGGAIHAVVTAAFAAATGPNGNITALFAAQTAQQVVRGQNQLLHVAGSVIRPLPDLANEIPPSFPPTNSSFFNMGVGLTNSLITAYRLPAVPGETHQERRGRLALFCGVKPPH